MSIVLQVEKLCRTVHPTAQVLHLLTGLNADQFAAQMHGQLAIFVKAVFANYFINVSVIVAM